MFFGVNSSILSFFLLLLCDESDRAHAIAAKEPTKSMNSHQKTS